MSYEKMSKVGSFIFTLLFFIGFVVAMRCYFQNEKPTLITIRGAGDKIVKSQSATWTISFNSPASVSNLDSSNSLNAGVIGFKQFAVKNGISESEITLQSPSVQQINDANSKNNGLYISSVNIVVNSNNVDLIKRISSEQLTNVSIQPNFAYVNYFYNNADNDTKNELIKQSISNASNSIIEVAKNLSMNGNNAKVSNLSVGSISILSSDGSTVNDTNGLYKKLRVISTVTYKLH